MEEITTEETQPLTGQLETPNERSHMFKSVGAMSDFIEIFNITNWQARSGYTSQGQYCIQLVYETNNN